MSVESSRSGDVKTHVKTLIEKFDGTKQTDQSKQICPTIKQKPTENIPKKRSSGPPPAIPKKPRKKGLASASKSVDIQCNCCGYINGGDTKICSKCSNSRTGRRSKMTNQQMQGAKEMLPVFGVLSGILHMLDQYLFRIAQALMDYMVYFLHLLDPYLFRIAKALMDYMTHIKQAKIDKPKELQKLTEKSTGSEGFPSNWDTQPFEKEGVREMCHLVTLSSDSQEYKDAIKTFQLTMPDSKWQVVEVNRIQNLYLYQQYNTLKMQMMSVAPKDHPLEKELFHGTNKDACENINYQGFNRNYAGTHAALYGKGVYLAVNADYSSKEQYSQADENGHKYVYSCLALPGEYTKGDKGMIVPPAKNPKQNKAILFDSLVDDVKDPHIFVMVKDNQVYPKYLITFKARYLNTSNINCSEECINCNDESVTMNDLKEDNHVEVSDEEITCSTRGDGENLVEKIWEED